MEITETQLEHIETICDIQLDLMKRIKDVKDDMIFANYYEAMCVNIEIIQDILKKVKS